MARRIVLPSGKTLEVIGDTGYLPGGRREKRHPTPHFDRLAERCDNEGWSLELVRAAVGGLSVQVWRVAPCGKLLGIARVTSTVDRAARAVLRAL